MLLSACVKDNPIPIDPDPVDPTSKSVLICNEGSFGTNTASLSRIDLETDVISNNIYEGVNGVNPGDVLQSIEKIGDRYYLVVNNSNLVIVTDSNFNKITDISLQSPRYIKAINSNKAYVSSIYTYEMYVINLNTNTKVATIPMDSSWTEEMLVVNSDVYTCNNDTGINYITKIDGSTNMITDRITIGGYAPQSIAKDNNGNIWVLAGDYSGKIGTLTQLNSASGAIIKTLTFDSNELPQKLVIGPDGNTLYVLMNNFAGASGIYKINSSASSIPNNYIVTAAAASYFYGFGVDPNSGQIYASDPKGFAQAGTINRYDADGNLEKSWTADIGPNNFYFVD